MRIPLASAPFSDLATLWNQFYPDRYRVTPELLKLKSVDCPVFDWGASSIYERDGRVIGFAFIKRPSSSLYRVGDIDQYHLSAVAYSEPGVCGDLISDVRQLLTDRGASRLVFGQDNNHFFPGCPKDFPKLKEFLEIEGFTDHGTQVDMERDLSDFSYSASAIPGDRVEVLSKGAIMELEGFLQREFPGRWHHDTLLKVRQDGPECVAVLYCGQRIEGFALIQDSSNRYPIGGAVWQEDLGPNWGSLGPIGVSKAVRGSGRGGFLLGSALQILKDRGCRQTIIDWTTLTEFYGKFGFEVSRSYESMSLKLG